MLRALTYHRVDEPDRTSHLDAAVVSATPGDFRRQMEHVRDRYHPVSLAQVMDAFHGGRPLPPRAVHVTFDDAYDDFESNAWPVLKKLRIPVTLFVATAYAERDGRSFWWDRLHRAIGRHGTDEWSREVRRAASEHGMPPGVDRHGLDARAMLKHLPHDVTERLVDRLCRRTGVDESPSNEILGWARLRALVDEGVAIGAHTRSHAALSHLTERQARLEIRASLDDLERELGRRPLCLAYPYGVCNDTVAKLAREEGCTLGFTCEDGLSTPGLDDPLRLRRTNITRRTSPRLFAIRMLPWFATIDRWRHRAEQDRLSA